MATKPRAEHHKDDSLETLSLTTPKSEVVRFYLTARMSMPSALSYTLLSFFAEMLEKGSVRYKKNTYEEKLEFLGASVSFSTEGNLLTLGVTVREAVLKETLQIISATLEHPLFLKTEIEKLKKDYTQAFHEEEDSTRALSYGMFTRALYAKDEVNYIPELSQRKKELSHLTEKTLKKAHALFLSAPWTVSVSGDQNSCALVQRVLAHLHTKAPQSAPEHHIPLLAPHVRHFKNVPAKQNIEFFIGNRLPLFLTDADFISFSFGIDVLGKRGGFSGRLMSTVREKEGLTYMIYAWIRGATASTCGHFNIATFFTPKDAEKGLSSTDREIQKIVKRGITKKEFDSFKVLLKNQFRLAHESTSSILALYHRTLVAGRTLEDVNAYPKLIDAITRKSVHDTLKKYLKPEMLVTAGAGPTKGLEEKA